MFKCVYNYSINNEMELEMKTVDQYKVFADAQTGACVSEPEFVGSVDLALWNKKIDTDSVHYDTYEVIDDIDDGVTTLTRAVEVVFMKKERTPASITVYTFSIADDSEDDSEAYAEEYQSRLEEEYPGVDISVTFSKSHRSPAIKIDFEAIDEDEEDKYESEYEASEREMDCIKSIGEFDDYGSGAE